jgi:4,5-DOPA dioxygenase extradiol
MKTHLPTLFVPHGAPTFALRPGAAGAAMTEAARHLPRPRAIVIISPHWDTEIVTVGHAERLSTIHDFSGFPQELYQLTYPATGCPEGAHEVAAAIAAAGLPVREITSDGLDHGAWVPLRLMYPEADVPVIPVSLQSHAGVAQAYKLGQALAPLVDKNFLIIGSGNITHNLRDYMSARQNGGQAPSYVRDFPEWMATHLQDGDIDSLMHYREQAPGAVNAHPTDEHLLPLYVALGAAGAGADVQRFHAGISDYVLAMDAYAFSPKH